MYLGDCQLDAAYLGGCSLDKLYLGMCEVFSSVPAAVPVFQANVADPDTGFMQGVAIGTGGLTEARAGSLWAKDFEGVDREFLAQEAARSGGRVIRNLVAEPNNLLGAGWSTAGTVSILDSKTARFVGAGTSASRVQYTMPDAPNAPGTYADRIKFTSTADVEGFRMRWRDSDGNASEIPAIPLVAGVPVIVSVPTDTTGISWLVWLYAVSTETFDITIEDFLVSPTQGSSDPATPPEFIDTGVQVSARYNGNSVTDTTVTEGIGALLPETPRLVHMPEATNTFLNNYTPATQDIAGQNGTRTCWLEGTGSVTLSGGLSGVVTEGAPITGDPGGATVTCTVAGTPDFVMFEDNAAPTAPIPTDSTPETRPACALSFDAANHDDTEGTYYLEVQFGTNGQGIYSDFLRVIGANIRLTDGSNFVDVLGSVDTPHKIGIVYGAGTMRLNIDGVWSADTTYDGALPDGVLDLFRTSAAANDAGVIERYATKDESIIDGKMA